jgi:hypothetical protein
MKDIEFFGAVLKLLGFACLVFAIAKTGDGINAIYQFNKYDIGLDPAVFELTIWVPVAIIYLVGLLFIKFPAAIAKSLLPKTSILPQRMSCDHNTLTIVGFTLLGTYLLTAALPDLAVNILYVYQQYSLRMAENPEVSQTLMLLVANVIEFGLGLFLLLGGKGINRLILRLRG